MPKTGITGGRPMPPWDSGGSSSIPWGPDKDSIGDANHAGQAQIGQTLLKLMVNPIAVGHKVATLTLEPPRAAVPL